MTTDDEAIGRPVGVAGRVVLCLAACLIVAGFALARQLEPDPRGYGTHQRLGLPECTFQMLFRRPCPGCGMTTSFALFVRGRWVVAARANPAGLLLATLCAMAIPWCAASAWQGRLFWMNDPWPVLACLMGSWGALGLLVWLVRWLG